MGIYIHLYSPERQQQQVKKSTKHTTTKTNKHNRNPFFLSAIVTIALSCTIYELCNVEEFRDLEI